MAKYIKIILFLLLTISFRGIASDASGEKRNVDQCNITSAVACQDRVGIPVFPYSPIAELGNNLQTTQLITTTRLQRVLIGEYFYSLKSILLNCANRESVLLQHRKRSYNRITPYFCQNSSEYYVFALRHIII